MDSVRLLDEGFKVTSTDLSEDMLRVARSTRRERGIEEEAFGKWGELEKTLRNTPHHV